MIETATGTFLLTWNPRKTPWRDYEEWENGKSTRKPPLDSWSTGKRKTIPVGSRVFLVRQHDHRGIIASGHTRVPVYQDAHWNASDHDANYVDVRLEVLLPLRAAHRRILEAARVGR